MRSEAHDKSVDQGRRPLLRLRQISLPPLAHVGRDQAADIMLNPSVANSKRDDATITRCIRRAQQLGAGGIIVMNLFALVAMKRTQIYRVPDPVGPSRIPNWSRLAMAHCM